MIPGPETPSTEAAVSRTPAGRWASLKRLGPAGILSILALVLPPLGALVLLSQMENVAEPLRTSPYGRLLTVIGFAVLAGFALLPTAALSLFAGWAFGFVSGLVDAVIGFTLAGAIGFYVSGRVSGRRALEVVDEHPRWRAVHRALLDRSAMRTFWIVALLRAPTLPPFAMTSVILAALKARSVPYLLGTAVGVAPRTAAYAYLASTLQKLDFSAPQGRWIAVGGLAATAVTVLILTYVARRVLARITDEDSVAAAAPLEAPSKPLADTAV